MTIWIISSLDEEIIQGEETIQGRKLYEEIRYSIYEVKNCHNAKTIWKFPHFPLSKKNGATRKFFGPSYFVRALATVFPHIVSSLE